MKKIIPILAFLVLACFVAVDVYSDIAIPNLYTYKLFPQLLAQSNPAATTLTSMYVCPPTSGVVLTAIWVANRDTSAHKFRIAIANKGEADDPKQYLYYDISLAANSSLVQSVNLPLNPGDIVRVYADAQQLSFSLYGQVEL